MRNYPLAGDPDEYDRLALQGAYFRPATDEFLRAAGIRPGMRVLDVGCGTGQVSVALADAMGGRGAILGIDQFADPLEAARAAVRPTDSLAAAFVPADLNAFDPPGPFDAAVGRLVLMYAEAPVEALRRVRSFVRPGGVVAFLEADHADYFRTDPPSPVFDGYRAFVDGVAARRGVRQSLGPELVDLFRAAGYADPREVRPAPPAGGRIVELLAATYCSLARAEYRRGELADPPPAPSELAGVLAAEVARGGLTVRGSRLVGVYARVEPPAPGA